MLLLALLLLLLLLWLLFAVHSLNRRSLGEHRGLAAAGGKLGRVASLLPDLSLSIDSRAEWDCGATVPECWRDLHAPLLVGDGAACKPQLPGLTRRMAAKMARRVTVLGLCNIWPGLDERGTADPPTHLPSSCCTVE